MGAEHIYSGPGVLIWGIDANGDPNEDSLYFDMSQGGMRLYTQTTYFEPTFDQTGSATAKTIKTGAMGYVDFEMPDLNLDEIAQYHGDTFKVLDSLEGLIGNGLLQKLKFQFIGTMYGEIPRKRAVIIPVGVVDPSRFIYLESCGIKFDANLMYELEDNPRLPIQVVAYPSVKDGILYTWGDISE